MKKIKYLKDNKIRLDGVRYRPYTVGNLPPSFGFIFQDNRNGEETEGIVTWFNHKGFTYLIDLK
jgi:hypothetical protein